MDDKLPTYIVEKIACIVNCAQDETEWLSSEHRRLVFDAVIAWMNKRQPDAKAEGTV